MAAREEAERRREELEAEANPGVLVTMDSGLQYREMDVGRPSGKVAAKGDEMFVLYKVFRLAPGAYFKYSSGGTPILMFSQGYGYEGQVRARVRRPSIRIRIRLDRAVGRVGARDETLTDRIESSNRIIFLPSFRARRQDDVGEPYVFALGSDGMPRGVSPALYGMREGGKRRILVPPNAGWVNDDVKPRAPSFGASRRLANHREEPLLVEVDVLRIRKANEPASGEEDDDVSDAADGGLGFKLPAPPSPFRDRLGETRETAEASGDAGAGAVEDEPVAV
jgi:hypothetical protein